MMVLAALREIRGPTDNTIQHEMQTTVRFNACKRLHRPTFGNKNYHSYKQSCALDTTWQNVRVWSEKFHTEHSGPLSVCVL